MVRKFLDRPRRCTSLIRHRFDGFDDVTYDNFPQRTSADCRLQRQ
jgi:hypothetical protein